MNRLTLPLEVGKKYVRRDGAAVTVDHLRVTVTPGGRSQFIAVTDGPPDEREAYADTGRASDLSHNEHYADIVADYVEQPKAHPHAASMLLYAQDAAETDKPWLRWQFRREGCDWESPQVDSLTWNPFTEYRRKPKTIRIGAFDVPEPLRVAPARGESVWAASAGYSDLTYQESWTGCPEDRTRLVRGLLHSTREAATLHATALLSFSAP